MSGASTSSRTEGNMNRQIVQLFHNLIGKGIKPGGKADGQSSGVLPPHNDDRMNPADSAIQDRTVTVKTVDRKTFDNIVNESINRVSDRGCLLIGNVDRCRDINNIYGRDAGDAVLRYAVDVLSDVFEESICIGGGSGDVFTWWIQAVSRDGADAVRRNVGIVNDRMLHPTEDIPPSSLSVGAAFCEPGDDCRGLMKKAQKALCLVKESGRCGCEISL